MKQIRVEKILQRSPPRKRRKTGDESLDAMVAELLDQNQKLSSLLNVSREIMKEVKLERLLKLIMKKVTSVMDAERSTLFLLDDKSDELYALVAQKARTNAMRFPNGKGIAGSVGKTGQTINLKNAYDDPRFNKEFDRKTGFKTRSLLSMPIKNTRGKIIGVTQVLNKIGPTGYFTEDDENLLSAFSSIAAISLENSLAYETINDTMNLFERFVPSRYLESIARDGLNSVQPGHGEEVKVSILFSDIRDFTSLSEQMDADATLIFLNDYLHRMNDVIARQGGFVDKFIGDAIMSVFDEGSSDSAIRAGVEMLKALRKYNRERTRKGETPIRIGMGLHFGRAVLGTVGSKDRMDSTIIGDSVNLAARMEGITKQYGCPFMITEDAYRHLRQKQNYLIREIDTVRVKGKEKPIRVYEVFDADPTSLRNKKLATRELLEEGIRHYKQRRLDRALQSFHEGANRFKQDRVFEIYLKRCKEILENRLSLPGDWDGSIRILEK